MNPLVLIVLGLLIGWLVEWVIDWFFWRRRYRALEVENAELKAQLKGDLKTIKGIGPVIAARLNNVGVHSFEDLAKLSPDQLREIVGTKIEKLVDKEGILKQARQLAKKR
jgi:predicted flap endonuclease-1-like 5' DNA nuclease